MEKGLREDTAAGALAEASDWASILLKGSPLNRNNRWARLRVSYEICHGLTLRPETERYYGV